ncbi:hypothetical protein VNO77_06079 [Canavalia gladiata]|uniref:Uncharacterized protein n=1 Tax=Canavalia gladiata TaxID=3824 RepID=A0AAN9R982_CANGL
MKEEGSSGTHVGGVIFFLNNLPFDLDSDSEDDFPLTDVRNRAYRVENLAVTYRWPLERILSSKLNQFGFIRAIYVNFGPKGYYELNPNTKPVTRPVVFEEQLRTLFEAGIVSNPDNREVVWQKITDLSSLVSNLPANTRTIGCLHGPAAHSQELMYFRDYIRAASDEQIYVFVVGQIDTQDVQAYVNDFVKVSDYDLIACYCLDDVISAVEKKWGLS